MEAEGEGIADNRRGEKWSEERGRVRKRERKERK